MSEHALEAGRSYLAGAFEHLGWAIEIADGGVRDDASVLTCSCPSKCREPSRPRPITVTGPVSRYCWPSISMMGWPPAPLPAAVAGQPLTLVVGLYDPAGGARAVAVDDSGARQPDDAVRLGEVPAP